MVISWESTGEKPTVGYSIAYGLYRPHSDCPQNALGVMADIEDGTFVGGTIKLNCDHSRYLKYVMNREQIAILEADYSSRKKAEQALERLNAIATESEIFLPTKGQKL